MTQAVKELVDRFASLPEAERQEVLAELLRRAGSEPHELPDDQDLTASADQLFQDLDAVSRAGESTSRAFAAAARLDPDLAIAYWSEALVICSRHAG